MKPQLTKQETIALREKIIGKSCQLFFRNDPLKILRGEGQYLYDEKNDAYLDCINNVAHELDKIKLVIAIQKS
ncbi:hypothetical protein NQ317_011624 [Molorchus minor]|uniref:Uncharacterized protein n=1 Tax=Molorchus minor TaxID=1323400 RepID=A0ABQ9J244_9CUCU|nr:hypothetical protein NQ317_011624 [Molorchus minor]